MEGKKMSAPSPILLDCGTGYAKIFNLEDSTRAIVPARRFIKKLSEYDIKASTGHNLSSGAGVRVNELVALAEGSLSMVDEPDFTVLDCGARDVKYVQIRNRRVAGMDWNTECGAFAGQVVELLTRYLDIEPENLPSDAPRIPVVCGVLGMTSMFDMISKGKSHEEALAGFLRGVAFNCETLVGRPDRLYLSGGLCDNKAFVSAFTRETIPLGRFVLIEGLRKIYSEKII